MIDVALDGLLLGLGFSVGAAQGRLLTIALALEGVTLGLALGAELLEGGRSRLRALGIVAGVGALFPLGAAIGTWALAGAPLHVIGLVIAFGLAALLFLVTEELLVEAHEQGDSPFATAMFFVGFALFLVLGSVV